MSIEALLFVCVCVCIWEWQVNLGTRTWLSIRQSFLACWISSLRGQTQSASKIISPNLHNIVFAKFKDGASQSPAASGNKQRHHSDTFPRRKLFNCSHNAYRGAKPLNQPHPQDRHSTAPISICTSEVFQMSPGFLCWFFHFCANLITALRHWADDTPQETKANINLPQKEGYSQYLFMNNGSHYNLLDKWKRNVTIHCQYLTLNAQ